jgi:polysaccharide transporter, PST family
MHPPAAIRQLARDNLVLIVQYAVGSLVPLLLIPHIVKTIGLSEFGGLAVALAAAGFGTVVVQYAFQLSGPRQLTLIAEGDSPTAVVCRIGSAKLVLLGLVLLVTLALAVLAALADYRVSGPQTLLLVVIPLATALNTAWHLQTAGHFTLVSALAIVGATLALGAGFLGVRDAEPSAVLLASVALCIGSLWTGFATLVASVRLLRREPLDQRISWRSPWVELRDGVPLFGSQFVASLYGASGPLVIGALIGLEQAGAFAAVERASGAVVGALLLTHTAAYPKLVRLYREDPAGYRKLIRLVVGLYVAAAAVLAVAIVALWPQVLQFLLGDKGREHGPLLACALIWVGIAVVGPVLTGYLTTSGQAGKTLPLTLATLCASVLLGVPGTLMWGAWAWMAALCASQTIVVAYALRTWAGASSARLKPSQT